MNLVLSAFPQMKNRFELRVSLPGSATWRNDGAGSVFSADTACRSSVRRGVSRDSTRNQALILAAEEFDAVRNTNRRLGTSVVILEQTWQIR